MTRFSARCHPSRPVRAALPLKSARSALTPIELLVGGLVSLPQVAGSNGKPLRTRLRCGDQGLLIVCHTIRPGLVRAPAAGRSICHGTISQVRPDEVGLGQLRPRSLRKEVKLGVDAQAALTVLGRLPSRVRVSRGDLRGANLSEADFSGANLTAGDSGGDADVLAGLIDEPHRGRVQHRARPLSGGSTQPTGEPTGYGARRPGHPLTTHSHGEEDMVTETQPGRERSRRGTGERDP